MRPCRTSRSWPKTRRSRGATGSVMATIQAPAQQAADGCAGAYSWQLALMGNHFVEEAREYKAGEALVRAFERGVANRPAVRPSQTLTCALA